MNKRKVLLIAITFLFALGTLFAQTEGEPNTAGVEGEPNAAGVEGAPNAAGSVDTFVNNQYLQENTRLIGLAETSYTAGEYDQAIDYAQQAMTSAQQSDDYITQQMKMRAAEIAITAAQAKIDWARGKDAPNRYAEIWTNAETAFTGAQEAKTGENWDAAAESAKQVVAILQQIPDEPTLPAQYRVRQWTTTRDCLWNIAAKKEIYGDPFKWRVIYDANKSKIPIQGNPNLLEPDTLLDIPSIAGEFRSGVLEEQ